MKTAKEIAEEIGYHLSNKGTAIINGKELIKEYAKQKCKEQRELCAEKAGNPNKHVLNAPEPEFE